MFENSIKKYLKDDEKVIEVVRKYILVFTVPILFSVIIIIACFFTLYPLFHNWGNWGVIIFCLGLLIGIVIALRVLILYSLNIFIITDQRIIDIDQRGFFDRTVSETTYNKIQDVSFRIRGVGQTLLRYGSIIIQTAGSQANIELHGVKNPENVQRLIIDLQQEINGESSISEEKLQSIVEKVHATVTRTNTNNQD